MGGFEPPTPTLPARRTAELSCIKSIVLVGAGGFEPPTPTL